jgi:hypothetical protein
LIKKGMQDDFSEKAIKVTMIIMGENAGELYEKYHEYHGRKIKS